MLVWVVREARAVARPLPPVRAATVLAAAPPRALVRLAAPPVTAPDRADVAAATGFAITAPAPPDKIEVILEAIAAAIGPMAPSGLVATARFPAIVWPGEGNPGICTEFIRMRDAFFIREPGT